MHTVGTALPRNARALLALDDDDMAGRSAASLLITAHAPREAEDVARRLHSASMRAEFPFLRIEAGDFPIDPRRLRETCSNLLDDAAGGTLFINDVEEMPRLVQDVLVEMLAELQLARAASIAVRVVSGTTVSLLDRIVAGTFSERLFYQLNIIHLTVEDAASEPMGIGERS
jgi:DNA-binding NtrC family response regulator